MQSLLTFSTVLLIVFYHTGILWVFTFKSNFQAAESTCSQLKEEGVVSEYSFGELNNFLILETYIFFVNIAAMPFWILR